MRLIFIALITCAVQPLWAERLLVAMDDTQRDHLKSYGLAFWTLERGIPVEWLLNYRAIRVRALARDARGDVV